MLFDQGLYILLRVNTEDALNEHEFSERTLPNFNLVDIVKIRLPGILINILLLDPDLSIFVALIREQKMVRRLQFQKVAGAKGVNPAIEAVSIFDTPTLLLT